MGDHGVMASHFSWPISRVFLSLLFLVLFCPVGISAQETMDGKASYYSNTLHGRKMSSGKRYNRDSLTCAHKTLPFGTKLKVTNPSNGKEVVVEVADRGPYAHGRVIDLSYAAARELGIIASGVEYVKIEVLRDDIVPPYNATDGIGLPEMEYGMAGVCYEFIPEWGSGGGKETIPSKRSDKTQKVSAQEKSKPHSPSSSRSGQSVSKPHNGQSAQKPASGKSPAKGHAQKDGKKEQDSNSWTDFFNKLRDFGGSLFD